MALTALTANGTSPRFPALRVALLGATFGDAERGVGASLPGARPRLHTRCLRHLSLGVDDRAARVGERLLEVGDTSVRGVELVVRVTDAGVGVA